MRLPTLDPSGVDQLNMTPMIDCVFQLLIFFMLVTDISAVQLEAIRPPRAAEARPDDRPADGRVIVNVAHRDDVGCPDFGLYDDDPASKRICRHEGHWIYKLEGRAMNLGELARELAMRAEDLDSHGRSWRNPDSGLSDLPLMIRADARAPYEAVARLLQVCGDPACGVKIWKVEIGARNPPQD